jgi:hypothetical protein
MIGPSSPSKQFSPLSTKVVKFVVLGHGGSSFARAFTTGVFQEEDKAHQSLGATFYSKMLLSKTSTIRFQIWDVPRSVTEEILGKKKGKKKEKKSSLTSPSSAHLLLQCQCLLHLL